MRTKTLSVSLFLALLLSLFVATPAQAAGSPAAPTNVTVTDNDCTDAVTVSWTPSASATAGYRIHVYARDTNYYGEGYYSTYSLSLIETGRTTNATLDLPRSYDDYYFQVSSVSDFRAPFTGGADGEPLAASSSQSAPIEASFRHFWNVPAPGNVSVAADPSVYLASARWARPAANGQACNFDEYHYTIDDLSSSDDPSDHGYFDGSIPVSDASIDFPYLPVHRYEFCIWASSQDERSYDSEYRSYSDSPVSCTSFGAEPSAPDSPGGLRAYPSGTSITLTWNPTYYDGGSPITGYRVSRNGTDAAGSGPWSTVVSADRRSQTFTNLRPNTSYTFTVQAINALGTSSPTTFVQTADPYVAPSVPTRVAGTTNDSVRSATISWAPPESAGNPAITGYRVSRNGVDNAGAGPWSTTVAATARSFTFTHLAAGATYTMSVSAINAGGDSGAASTVVRIGGTALTAATPTVTGTAAVGSTLTASAGTWGPSPVALAYQWRANGTAISGATGTTYRPVAGDAGRVITVAVTGSKSGYVSTTRVSSGTAAVTGGAITAATPTISGTAKVGSTLTAKPGTWGPSPVALAYQWKANGTALSGATSATYTPTGATLGKTITVTVTGSKSGFTAVTKTSAKTSAVVAGTLSAATPTITGTAKVGSTLTAKPGTWGPSPVALTYQWKANGTAISGATSATYKPTSATVGKKITVTVTGKKADYTTATRTSAATAAVVK
ncbi:fibronectin type III domain-containing protein [Rathayibacter sp. AY1A7]|uniref:fibronectin type III domain-containing protein n=1 Tax=Rathayibacter sp. AY1A7 TaxID=2080524 RepID=UPI0015E40E5A|nr:fibronectin type III domain-containing protein [Rathayibacter sp. AY1A7]